MKAEFKFQSGKTLRAEMPSPFAWKKMLDEQKGKLGNAAAWAAKFPDIKTAQDSIKDAPQEIVRELIEYSDHLVNYKLELINCRIAPDSDIKSIDDLNPEEFDELMKGYEESFFGIYMTKSRPTGATIAAK